MALIALVALIVIGPKELPKAMRSATKWIRKARSLAREFQSGVDDMVREADLEDARKAIQTTTDFDVDKALEQSIDPTGDVRDEAKDLESAARSEGAEEPVSRDGDAVENSAPPVEEINEKASVIEPPLKVAPAHSVTPPVEETVGADAGNGTSKRA